jgi:hypothetical protein
MRATTLAVLFAAIVGALIGGSMSRHADAQQQLGLAYEWQEILSHMSIEFLDDGQGGQVKTIRFTGVNVQIVNGMGATNGNPVDPESIDPAVTDVNGTGNLIVGYNEPGNPDGDDRTGSHNIVVGQSNNFAGFGGLVACKDNAVFGAFSSVSAGTNNTAYALCSVSGGDSNVASGGWSSVTGGFENWASGNSSSISGGAFNEASANQAWVGGGSLNEATGYRAGICGGWNNAASGDWSCVGGGSSRSVAGEFDWGAGSLFQEQ